RRVDCPFASSASPKSCMSLFGCAKRHMFGTGRRAEQYHSRSPQRPLCAKQTHAPQQRRQRNGVLNYLIGEARIPLASVAAKPQVATNRRCLAQEALRRAWMIDSLVRESRSALRHLRRGGEMRAHLLTTAAVALLAAMPAHARMMTGTVAKRRLKRRRTTAMEQQAHLDGGDPFRCVYLIAASAAALAAAMMGAAGPAARPSP